VSEAAKPTVLGPVHERLGGRMVEFHGWWMPVQYESVLAEARAVRTGAGVFDVSHMGILRIGGERALEAVQFPFTSDASQLRPGEAQYSLMLNPQGGIVDDLIIYRDVADGDQYLLVVNASNAAADEAWIAEHLRDGAVMENASNAFEMLAVQGPEAVGLIEAVAGTSLADLPRMGGRTLALKGAPCFVARTGYTGEDGVEVFCPPDAVDRIFEAVLKGNGRAGAQPCGLGARDVLRMEAGLPLHGAELTVTTSPVEAGLNWVVKPDKGEFIGREAYVQARSAGTLSRRTGLKLAGRRIAHAGAGVLANDGPVGTITSGTFSPMLGCAIAQAYVDSDVAAPGTVVQVEVGKGLCDAEAVRLPFRW